MTPNELRKRIQSIQSTLDQIKAQLESISEQNKANASEAEPRPQESANPEIHLPPSITSYYDSENKDRKSKAKWKRAEFGIALGGLFAVVAYVIVTACTLSEIKKQVNISQDQLSSMDRPWIAMTVTPAGDITNGVNGIETSFILRGKNYGRSPAQNVWINAILLPGLEFGQWRGRQLSLCGNRPKSLTGVVVFPNDQKEQWHQVPLARSDLDRFLNSVRRTPTGSMIPISIVGCTDYTFPASPDHHQTGFAFTIWKKPAEIIDIAKLPLPKEQVNLIVIPAGSFAN